VTDPEQKRILVVEDDATISGLIAYNLEKAGYAVLQEYNGRAGLQTALTSKVDLVLLDLMLPGLDGLSVSREIVRRRPDVPIIMLTARSERETMLEGFGAGADDYITKPFSMRELMARVKAHLRRIRMLHEEAAAEGAAAASQKLTVGDIVVDMGRREVSKAGQPVVLTPREFDLMAFLARNRGLVLSRDVILQHVWGWDFAGGTRTVDVHVRGLREKIEDDPAHPARVVTVRGVGYRLEP